ncbi:MAG: hypothetical protein KBS46_05840 [Clostridiales bacterium]|nr:hypothetical protein [Candidatus Apopatocola equi]
MEYRIEAVKTLTLGTAETELELGCGGFLLQNNSESAVLYFKEKAYDGAAVTAANGFALRPGETMHTVLCGRTLSLAASAANTAAAVLLLKAV